MILIYRSSRHVVDFTKAIEIDPKWAEAYCVRSSAYSGKGQYDQAIADINKAIQLKKEFVMAYYIQALIYEKINRNKEAIEAYRNLIKYASSQLGYEIQIMQAKRKIVELEKRQ